MKSEHFENRVNDDVDEDDDDARMGMWAVLAVNPLCVAAVAAT